MEVVIACLAITGAFVLMVVALTLFFRILDWITRKIQRVVTPKLPRRYVLLDILDPEAPVTIHLADGGELRDVFYLGALPSEFDKTGAVPLDLRSFVVIGHPDGMAKHDPTQEHQVHRHAPARRADRARRQLTTGRPAALACFFFSRST